MRLVRLSCSPAFNEITGFAYVLAAPRKSPSLSAGSRSNASLRSNLCKNGKIKRGLKTSFYFALGAIRLGFAPRSRIFASKPRRAKPARSVRYPDLCLRHSIRPQIRRTL